MTSLESKINNFVNQTGYYIPCLPTTTTNYTHNYSNTNTSNYLSYSQYSIIRDNNIDIDTDINNNLVVLENLWDSYA
jgi:hypothetical protein